jgi:hypothetical protein
MIGISGSSGGGGGDPDPLIQELLRHYEATAKKLAAIVLHPPGVATQEFNRARAQIQLNQVHAEIEKLQRQVGAWTGKAIPQSVAIGQDIGNQQLLASLKDAGIPAPEIKELKLAEASLAERGRSGGLSTGTSWANVDTGAVKVIQSQTLRDLGIGVSGMEKLSTAALRKIEALKVSPRDISDILGGRIIIEGKPAQGVRELRDLLQAVHGKKTLIPCKDGIDREYDTSYYADLAARTRTRDAVEQSKHDQFASMDCDLVKVVGTRTRYPCTMLVGRIFSLSGESKKYPAFSTVSDGQEPYKYHHPHCGKYTQVYIASAEAMRDRVRSRIAEIYASQGITARTNDTSNRSLSA